VQGVRLPCGWPVTGEHVPAVVPSHASHWPPQAWSQHTPSWQMPLEHSSAFAQAWLFVFFCTHMPIAQYDVEAQSWSLAHPLEHAPPTHG
jgi:hypothetical protein